MKARFLIPVLMFFSLLGRGQNLQPDEKNALINVVVMDFQKKPMSAEKISFISKKTQKIYSGTTDNSGKFQVLLPKDAGYDVKYMEFTSEAAYEKPLAIPKGEEHQFLTFTYTIRVQLPEKYTLNNVMFDVNKATLTSESFKELDKFSSFMNAKKTMVIEVAGYTDNVGTDDANLKLSQQRAEAIREYLLKHGVSAGQIIAKGYGASNPVATNDTPEGRKINRRTEIHIIKQ